MQVYATPFTSRVGAGCWTTGLTPRSTLSSPLLSNSTDDEVEELSEALSEESRPFSTTASSPGVSTVKDPFNEPFKEDSKELLSEVAASAAASFCMRNLACLRAAASLFRASRFTLSSSMVFVAAADFVRGDFPVDARLFFDVAEEVPFFFVSLYINIEIKLYEFLIHKKFNSKLQKFVRFKQVRL